VRDETKYHRMLAFGEALPRIRRRVDRDISRRALSREKVVATVARLLDVTTIRVGNDEYARDNGSYGLTTLRGRHVSVNGSRIGFRFRGKGGRLHELELSDARIARVVRRCRDLPGQQLFQYVDADGVPTDIASDDVNEYLSEASGEDFTAKEFRTWTGTVLAAWALHDLGDDGSVSGPTGDIVAAVESIAAELGNTPAICRRCYIHPEVVSAHLDGTLRPALAREAGRGRGGRAGGLTPKEAAVLAFLRRRLEGRGRARAE
jgi:DNA topoisomerase-1